MAGGKTHNSQVTGTLISIIAILVSIYHLLSVSLNVIPYDLHKVVHIACGLVLVYLLSLHEIKGKGAIYKKIFSVILLGLSLFASIYFFTNYEEISTRLGISIAQDTIVGTIIVILVLEATRRAWGIVIPLIAFLAIMYGYFGQYLPGILHHSGLSFDRLIGYASSKFQGVYGSLTILGAKEVFMFIFLGATLQASGATEFFMKVAQGIGERFRSGPAQAAIISSGALGSVSGNSTTNVATTGVITIPLMIRKGFDKDYAGGVEAAASTGGQIMPPIMGTAAFIMANNTGVPYATIALVALLPALVYYLYLAVSVQIRAVKLNIPFSKTEDNQAIKALKEDGYLMLSLVVLVIALYFGIPVALSALYAVVTLVILVTIKKLINHRTDLRNFYKELGAFLFESLKMGAINGTKLGLILASLGIMVEMFVVTGFAQRVSFQMLSIAGGSLLLLLLLIALTCLLFGLGMPTAGAYITVSVLAAPALVEHGIPLIASHFFVFYYALISVVTPPVGTAALVAAGISGGQYWGTAIHALRLALPGFLLPFYFVFREEILLINSNIFESLTAFLTILFSTIAASAILEKHLLYKLNLWQILILLLGICLSFIPAFFTSLLSMSIFGIVILIQLKVGKNRPIKD